MKLGNTSQTIVPVPNFFLNNNINQMETFQVSKSKKYFREKDLFQNKNEINFSNYTKNQNRKHENFNRTKYLPDLSNLNNFLNRSSNSTHRNTTKNTTVNFEFSNMNQSQNLNNINNQNSLNQSQQINPTSNLNTNANLHSVNNQNPLNQSQQINSNNGNIFPAPGAEKAQNLKKDSYENFRNFMEKTNVSNYTSCDLRNEIKTNISVLIDKINHNYDLDKWASTDTRTNFVDTNTDNIHTINNRNKNYFETVKNNFYSKTTKSQNKKNLKENNDCYRFKSIIKDKISGMDIDESYKQKIVSKIDLSNNSFSEKFYKTKTANIINTHIDDNNNILDTETYKENKDRDLNSKDSSNKDNDSNNNETENNQKENKSPRNSLNKNNNNNSNAKFDKDKSYNFNSNNSLINSKNNLTFNMNYNYTSNNHNFMGFGNTSNRNNMKIIDDNLNINKICLPLVMNKYSNICTDSNKNQKNVDRLKIDNSGIYTRFKGSNLFKDFPSPDRKEFIIKKGEKLRLNMRKDKVDKSLVNFSRYNANKHSEVFCESYDTNNGFMEKFRKSKDAFV